MSLLFYYVTMQTVEIQNYAIRVSQTKILKQEAFLKKLFKIRRNQLNYLS